MTERTTKALLAAIALGLWANLALSVFETRLQAQSGDRLQLLMSAALTDISLATRNIDFNVERIAGGTCINRTIC
ncbi:MAG: hypothetical protein VW362_00995 [Candidatus Nanopelagicales bacterium]|jgi:hypothetical protein